MLKALLGWLLLAQLGGGPAPTLRFDVEPREAQLWMMGEEGLRRVASTRDGRFIVEQPRSNFGGARVLQCEFHCPGYRPEKLELGWNEVLQWSRSPGGGYPRTVRLRPQSAAAHLKRYPWLGLLAGLPLALPWLWLRWRAGQRHVRHMARLQQLVPEALRQADPLLGLAVGPYRLIARLGSGGMASVYRAVPDRTLDEREAVAIKLVRLDSDDVESRALLEKEISVTASLDHPNIVRTLDWGWEGSRPYLVMEWLEGGSLRERLGPDGLDRLQALQLLRPWFAAVAYAHSRGVMHRDLKPDNVMLTRSGLLKLMDFGVAGSQGDAAGVGLTGTPGYAAPEGCDQYSLGVCAFELLCGRRPFEHPEVFGLIRLQLETDPPLLSSFRPEYAGAVDAVLARMLARRREDRYPSVESAGEALFEALQAGLD